MRDIRAVLERWGTWAAYEEERTAWPPICATFRNILPCTSGSRPSCSDNDGLIIDSCVSRLHAAGRDSQREVLFAYYVLRLSLRDVAEAFDTNRMRIRDLLASGESFVTGALVIHGVRLDMDLVLKATGQMETPDFLLRGFENVSGRALVPRIVRSEAIHFANLCRFA